MKKSNISSKTIKSLQESLRKGKKFNARVQSSNMPKKVKTVQARRVKSKQAKLDRAVRARSRQHEMKSAHKFILPLAAIPAAMALNKYGPKAVGYGAKKIIKSKGKKLAKEYGAPIMTVGTISGLAYLKSNKST